MNQKNSSVSTNTPSTPQSADLSLKDAFDAYQKQSDGQHKLWAYFQVVSLAILGYTIGTDKAQWSSWTYALVAASYAIFALSNQWVLVTAQKELQSLSKGIAVAITQAGPIGKTLKVGAITPMKIRVFHTAVIVFVMGAIYATWDDKCSAPSQCPRTHEEKKSS